MDFKVDHWGKFSGKDVWLYTAKTASGMEFSFTNFGATLVSIKAPVDNEMLNIAYGFADINGYLAANFYPGATVGRYANRIENGSFTINGKTFFLSKNEGKNTLHGGVIGLSHRIWNQEEVGERDGVGIVKLSLLSPDGEDGFPGNLAITATFQITDDNQLGITYVANTDQETHVNMTSHGYFNLSGFKSNVLDHMLWIDAPHYLPVNSKLIPTGELRNVSGTPFDFTVKRAVGADIDLANDFYDYCFALQHANINKPAAMLVNPKNRLSLTLYTNQPGIQLYTPINPPNILSSSINLPNHGNWAVCLEPQGFPNSPNTPNFPSTLVKPNEAYEHISIFQFEFV